MRRWLLLLCLYPSLAWSVVTFDTTTTGNCMGCTTLNVAHTNACVSAPLMLASVFDISSQVSGMAFHGDALTDLGGITFGTEKQWSLVNPDSGGEFDLVVRAPDVTDLQVAVTTLCGVDQVTPTGTLVTNDETTTSDAFVTSSVTVPSNGLGLNAAYICDFTNNATAVTSTVKGYLTNGNVDASKATVAIGGAGVDGGTGTQVSITVTYPYKFGYVGPIVRLINPGATAEADITITAQSVMRNE